MSSEPSQNQDIQICTLTSGLRVAYRRDSSEVEYFGASINAGSRDDPEGMKGLAHFVEHVIFKGTLHRRAWHIINRMESCGGELNAYTTKENTVVYSAFPAGNFKRAAELIGDLLSDSVFPESELAKERDVVAEEIAQYRDMPSEAVFDDFEDLIFRGSPLGYNILGDADSLQTFTSDICRRYLERHFTPSNMIVFYSGRESPDRVLKFIDKTFAGLSTGEGLTTTSRSMPPVVPRFSELRCLGNHQSNTVAGARIPGMFSAERWRWSLLTNILGGPGINSMLNLEMRERRGLVYSVEASSSLLTDAGLFTVFFGCDSAETHKCLGIVNRVLDKVASGALSNRFIRAAKRQYIGQLTLAADNHENSVLSMARAVLHYGDVLPRSEVIVRIESVTPQQISEAAATLMNHGLSTLTLE